MVRRLPCGRWMAAFPPARLQNPSGTPPPHIGCDRRSRFAPAWHRPGVAVAPSGDPAPPPVVSAVGISRAVAPEMTPEPRSIVEPHAPCHEQFTAWAADARGRNDPDSPRVCMPSGRRRPRTRVKKARATGPSSHRKEPDQLIDRSSGRPRRPGPLTPVHRPRRRQKTSR